MAELTKLINMTACFFCEGSGKLDSHINNIDRKVRCTECRGLGRTTVEEWIDRKADSLLVGVDCMIRVMSDHGSDAALSAPQGSAEEEEDRKVWDGTRDYIIEQIKGLYLRGVLDQKQAK